MIESVNLTWLSAIDIAFILCLVYFFFYVLKRSQIQNLMSVVVIFTAAYSLSKLIGLDWFSWMVEQFSVIFIVFIMIIFQNEIRRASERIRRGKLFFSTQAQSTKQPLLIKRILQSVEFLSKNKIGALIVIEQKSPLDEYTESGISIHADLTSELLCSLLR